MKHLPALVLCLWLGACATGGHGRHAPHESPRLKLAPATLGRVLAVQQQLRFTRKDGRDTVDALLEVDAHEVRLALLKAGQLALRLRWDGQRLDQWRAPWFPATMDGERILSDLQMALWPTPAINSALPSGWRLLDAAGGRQLLDGDEIVTDIRYPSPERVIMVQRREGFSLSVTSTAIAEPPR